MHVPCADTIRLRVLAACALAALAAPATPAAMPASAVPPGGATAEAAGPLPSPAPNGLRLTVSVACDFDDRWWELTFYPATRSPLELRWRAPGLFGARERSTSTSLDPEQREALYRRAQAAFAEFRIERGPRLVAPGAGRPWTGERTISLSAQLLDANVGRVDRIDLAVDVFRGRALPPATEALVEAVTTMVPSATLELDCR